MPVDGIATREEIAGLGKESEDEPEDDAAGGDVDVLTGWAIRLGEEGGAVGGDELFYREADALAKDGGKLGLATAAGLDGGEERAGGLVRIGRLGEENAGIEQEAEGIELRGGLAFQEPLGAVGFAPRGGVAMGIDNAPLMAVGEQGEAVLLCPHPLDDTGGGAFAMADAKAGIW